MSSASSVTMNVPTSTPDQATTPKKYRLPRDVRRELDLLVGKRDVSRDAIQNDLFMKYKDNPTVLRHVVYYLAVVRNIGFDELFSTVRTYVETNDPDHVEVCRSAADTRAAFNKK